MQIACTCSAIVLAVLLASPTLAQQPAPMLTMGPDAAAETTPSPRAPLMVGLDQLGAASTLDKYNLNIYGYIESGYMYDAISAKNGSGPTFLGFNGRKNSGILDKIALTIERTVDPTKMQSDFGLRVQAIYGADAALIHSNGMGDYQSRRNQGTRWRPTSTWRSPASP